jgi:hypothetical protein
MYAIDPTPDELREMLNRPGSSFVRWPARVLQEFASLTAGREGVLIGPAVYAGHSSATFPGEGSSYGPSVCWWTDRLGRRHWSVGLEGLSPSPSDPGIQLLTDRHPLEWIAPQLSGGWRERGGRREFVVACRCGVAGTPAEVAWMGRTCGPCHDREQEGLSAGLAAPLKRAATQLLVTDVGPLIAVAHTGARSGAFHDDRVTTLTAHDPWTGPPAWDWEGHGHREVATRGALVAVGGEGGEVTLLDARGGTSRRTFYAGRDLRSLTFAGPATLVTMHADRLLFWDVRPGTASAPTRQVTMRHWAGRGVFADRAGALVGAFTENGIEVCEVATGRPVERLAASPRYGLGGGQWAFDGSVFAAWRTEQAYRLGRWGPAAPARGFLARLMRGARLPDVTAEVDGPAFGLTPDGRFVVTADGERVTLRDRVTLEALAAFAPAGRPAVNVFAFAADGRLLAGTGLGLAAWPWHELFGVG